MSALVLLLAGLASARTYRLLTVDGIAEPVRGRFYELMFKLQPPAVRNSAVRAPRRKDVSRLTWRRHRLAESLSDGATCAWCIGFWLCLAWVGSGMAWGDAWQWKLVAGALAINYLTGHANSRLDIEESN